MALTSLAGSALAQTPASGKRVRRLLIHNAIVVDGNGTPASGPKDIVIENNLISDVIPLDPVAANRGSRGAAQADAVIDATGKYVLPGLINAHAHLQEERGGKPQPLEYELNIWLACGITAIRDVGSDTKRALELRKQSAEGEIAAPRIFVYPMFGRPKDAAAARARVQALKQQGADGIKLLGIDRDTMAAGPLERIWDFPAHGERLVSRNTGLTHVWVNGEAARADGVDVPEVYAGTLIS